MSSKYHEKLKNIRITEGFSQAAFAEFTGINIGTIKNYEGGKREVGISVIDRIISIDRFKKYTMWLMLDTTDTESGQVAPPLVTSKFNEINVNKATKKAEKFLPEMLREQSNIQTIINSIINLDDKELQQLAKLLSRRGSMLLLELLDPENQVLLNLRGKKKRAALRLESMGEEQFREILSKIEANTELPQEEINVFTKKTVG